MFAKTSAAAAAPVDAPPQARRRRHALLAAVLGTTACLGVTAPAATAAGQRAGATHCVTVLNGVERGEGESTVRSRTCFSGPGAGERAERAAPAGATQLMLWAEHGDWGGVYDRVYGYDGPCDAAGYSFTPSTWWSNNLSSFQVMGGCNTSYLSGPRGNGSFTGQVSYVGAALNDAVTYVKVWRG
ncbi:hypothetical protein GCM10010363_49910 [Streptomyces omiyaensis]|uniref:hypothetical protein n=1 Tax=Streptomyces omiyaensis TaxID=68247 RepID=UPI00167314DC|nr:hypothetical protein [Streptomyces omiyaensis]GGY62416.1 hypothetical protein GCM10010363_49910 [Streptomyces omiyaensis]